MRHGEPDSADGHQIISRHHKEALLLDLAGAVAQERPSVLFASETPR